MRYLAIFILILSGCSHVPKYAKGDCVDMAFIYHLDTNNKFDSGMYTVSIAIDGVSKDNKYYKFKIFDPDNSYYFLKYPHNAKQPDEWYASIETIDGIKQNFTFYPVVENDSRDDAKCNRVGK